MIAIARMILQNFSQVNPLYWPCEICGICIILGALWLLYKRIIYIDSATRKVTEVEVPWLGKFKSQSPVLIIFAIGAILVIYPIHSDRQTQHYNVIHGNVDSNLQPVDILGVVETSLTGGDGSYEIDLPQTGSPSRDQIYYMAGQYPRPFVFSHNITPREEKSGRVPTVKIGVIAGSQQAVPFQPVVNPRPAEFQH